METVINNRKKDLVAAFRMAFPKTIPVLTGFLVLGMAYGVLMQTKGYGVIWAVLMSAVAFCGSMQFVAITLLTVAFDPFQAFFLSFMVNARHLFYGISMLDRYKGLGKIRFFLIYTMCDETFTLLCAEEPLEEINRKYYYAIISALDYIYWVSGTLLGGILGQFLHFETKGLDFVLTALFAVLFTEQMRQEENRLSGFLGIICSLVALLFFGADNMVIPSMLLIVVLLLGMKRKIAILQ